MNLNLRRKKLLRILNYIVEQEKIIKLSNTPGYQYFTEMVNNCKRYINIYASKDIDDLIEYFEKVKIQKFGKSSMPGQLLIFKGSKDLRKFRKIYEHSEMEKIKHQILKTQKLNKVDRTLIDEDYTKGEVEVWKAEGVEYYVKVEDIMKLKGNPKVFVSQLKNLSLLIGMIQEQQFDNSTKEAECKFMLSSYAKGRGYKKEEVKRSGKFFDELKRDLYTGAYTTYRIDKVIINGHKYTAHGIPNFYTLYEPENYDGINWFAKFNDPWKSWILEILNRSARQYFIHDPKAIEDRKTTDKPYLFLFYLQLIKRKRANLLTAPLKIGNLLKDMKIDEQILARPKECFELLKNCLIYFSQNYQPVPELESFYLYNDFHKTETVKLPLSISEAFKRYNYIDFKDLLAATGIKDIREAYISFKRPHTKKKHKLNKEENELLKRTLKWFDGQVTKIPAGDQESQVKMYIKKIGCESYKRLFEAEANKLEANAVDFLTRVLPNKLRGYTYI